MRALSTLLIAAVLAAALPALGTMVTLERGDGTAVGQGEVCRFAAGDRTNPFKRWLVSQDVTCVPASAEVELPKGLWNVFARTSDAITTVPVLVDGAAAPAALALSLEKATTITPTLGPGQKGVVYAPRRASAWPVEGGRATVPADEELWLFVLEKGRLVNAGGQGVVLGWLQIPDADRAALENASGAITPAVRAISDVVRREADLLPSLRLLHGAFVRVRDVPQGKAELQVMGRGWVPARHTVKVESAVSVVKEPLTLRVAATLTVHWSTETDLEALDRSLGACSDERSGPSPQVKITISSCSSLKDAESCTPVREEEQDPRPRFGSVTLDDIVPGTYRAEMRFDKLPPISEVTSVGPLQLRELRLQAFFFEISGSVTLGGEPLAEDVRIRFPGGYGFAPAESQEYQAVLRSVVPSDAEVTVEACDGSPRAVVLTDEPIRRKARFDVDVPANELTINVSDTFTRETLRGATVQFDVMSLDRRRQVMQGKVTADSSGAVVMKYVPPRELRLTVSHPGYQKQKVEPFSMTARETKTLDVELVPLRGNNGKILSDRPFEGGAVFWFSPSGREVERADLAPDGTFVYANWHAPEETMAVVSLSHPLWVLHSPSIERRDTITIQFPNAPVRTFTASLETADTRSMWFLALAIGGVRVPYSVLDLHQKLRREQTFLRAGMQRVFRDVLATGPIDVILGPGAGEIVIRLAPDAHEVMFTR